MWCVCAVVDLWWNDTSSLGSSQLALQLSWRVCCSGAVVDSSQAPCNPCTAPHTAGRHREEWERPRVTHSHDQPSNRWNLLETV